MATVPNAKTWAPGNIPTAAEFNLDIRDALNFYLAPPRVSVYHTSNPDLAHSTWTRLDWNSEKDDDDGMHGATTQRLIAVTAGRYFVSIAINWEDFATSASGVRAVQVRKNSANDATLGQCICYDARHAQDSVVGDVGGAYQGTVGYAQLSATDYLEVFARHGTDNVISDNSLVEQSEQQDFCLFTAVWIGQ